MKSRCLDSLEDREEMEGGSRTCDSEDVGELRRRNASG